MTFVYRARSSARARSSFFPIGERPLFFSKKNSYTEQTLLKEINCAREAIGKKIKQVHSIFIVQIFDVKKIPAYQAIAAKKKTHTPENCPTLTPVLPPPPPPLPHFKNIMVHPGLRVNLHLFQGFFEEIEDLKYALQQAARLNSAYEKALKQLCSQSGVAFPKITTTSPKKRSRKRTRSQAREFTSR